MNEMEYRNHIPTTAVKTVFNDREGAPYEQVKGYLGPNDFVCVEKPTCVLIQPMKAHLKDGLSPTDKIVYSVSTQDHERPRNYFKNLEKESPLLSKLISGRDSAMVLHCYWQNRVLKGDPLFDQYMVESLEKSLQVVVEVDRLIANQYGICEGEEGYPSPEDECYKVNRTVQVTV